MKSPDIKDNVNELLQQGKKIEAIKFTRNALDLSLMEAKNLVEAAESELKASGRYNPPATVTVGSSVLLFSIFGIIGIALFALTCFLYWVDYKNTKDSISTPGIVTKFNYDGSDTAPVVEYQWNGETRIYASSVYSSPPAFEIGETVEILVNATDPQIVVINTLTERYLFAIVSAIMGFVFVLIGGIGRKLMGAK